MTEASKLKYTKTHEWVDVQGSVATVGITDHAQNEISDVVFVELPKVDQSVKQKDSVMIIESVKAAFDIYTPISGKVVKINEALKEKPELVNQSPLKEGWLFQLECSDAKELDGLMTLDQYDSSKESAH